MKICSKKYSWCKKIQKPKRLLSWKIFIFLIFFFPHLSFADDFIPSDDTIKIISNNIHQEGNEENGSTNYILQPETETGNIVLQFGDILGSQIYWNNSEQNFIFSNAIKVNGGGISLKEISSSPNPEIGYGKIYTKDDQQLYFLSSNGEENSLGNSQNMKQKQKLILTKYVPLRKPKYNPVYAYGDMQIIKDITEKKHKNKKNDNITYSEYTDAFPIANMRMYIYISKIEGTSGTMTIIGTSAGENFQNTISDDRETIPIDNTENQFYLTEKKWIEIESIEISGDLKKFEYQTGSLTFFENQKNNFRVTGYKMNAFSHNSGADMRFQMFRVKNEGNKKISFFPLEDLGIHAGAKDDQLRDYARGTRNYDPDQWSFWFSDDTLVWEQYDFDTYFSGGENLIDAKNGEGLLIRFTGEKDWITSVDHANIEIYLEEE